MKPKDPPEAPPLIYFVVKYGGLMLLLMGLGVGIVLALRSFR